MEMKRIRLSELELNKGQIEGLPSNPRQWTQTQLDQIARSIEETPELLEARGLIVYPHNGKYVILGGNMRFSALRKLNAADAPCYVIDAGVGVEKLREIVIKDNGSFGDWDMDMLANEWDDLPLCDWGVPAWSTEEVDKDDNKSGAMNDSSRDMSDDIESSFRIEISCISEREQEMLYTELTGRGLECRILTL